ncbi:MAG: hypothetical protein KC933_37850, partial [Myxococcales bacterium]|nr:hypothetical protein [Myxococcales bacterium]
VARRPAKAPEPEPKAPAVAPPPPAAPEPVELVEVKDYETKTSPAEPDPSAPPPKSFEELDPNLGWAVNQKGLAWTDLAEAAPEATRQWQRWYRKSAQPSDPRVVEQTFSTLMDALDGIEVDRALLERKLARCKRSVQKLAGSAGEPRYDSLKARYGELVKEVGFEPWRREGQALAVDITLLEADLRVLEAEAAAAPTSTSTSG